MAVLTNPYLSIGGTDLTAFVQSVEGTPNVNMVDNTVGNAAGFSTQEPGLESFVLKGKLKHTTAASSQPHTVLLAAHKTSVAFEYRQANTTASATNPKCTGTGYLIYDQHPMGQVGAKLECGFSLYVNASGYTWATS